MDRTVASISYHCQGYRPFLQEIFGEMFRVYERALVFPKNPDVFFERFMQATSGILNDLDRTVVINNYGLGVRIQTPNEIALQLQIPPGVVLDILTRSMRKLRVLNIRQVFICH